MILTLATRNPLGLNRKQDLIGTNMEVTKLKP